MKKKIFYYLWAQPESYFKGTTLTGRLLIQWAILPLSLFFPLLLYHLPKYKGISNPFLTPKISV